MALVSTRSLRSLLNQRWPSLRSLLNQRWLSLRSLLNQRWLSLRSLLNQRPGIAKGAEWVGCADHSAWNPGTRCQSGAVPPL